MTGDELLFARRIIFSNTVQQYNNYSIFNLSQQNEIDILYKNRIVSRFSFFCCPNVCFNDPLHHVIKENVVKAV